MYTKLGMPHSHVWLCARAIASNLSGLRTPIHCTSIRIAPPRYFIGLGAFARTVAKRGEKLGKIIIILLFSSCNRMYYEKCLF